MYERWIRVCVSSQQLYCYEGVDVCAVYAVSTAKKGVGEQLGSECTPRGWHQIYRVIGQGMPENSIFVSREWTGQIYSKAWAEAEPTRDWIVTRIVQLTGLEPGVNQGGTVDTLRRYIYIHGTPNEASIGHPSSHGCIRMRNADLLAFVPWVSEGMRLWIH